MKKFALAFTAAVAAVTVMLVFAPTATAYPDVRIDLTVNSQVLYGDESFTATATANVTCTWALSWNGITRRNTSSTYVTTYLAPTVTRITRIPLTSTCSYAAQASGRSKARTASPVSTVSRTIMITVLPRSAGAAAPKGAGGSLPGTGGPDKAVLFAGLALVVAGAGAVRVARRRAEDADLSVLTDLTGQTG
jgi:hypothetical protein